MSTTLDAVTRHVHQELVNRDRHLSENHHQEIRTTVTSSAPLLSAEEVDAVVERVSRQLFGLGPIEPLLEDPTITELMINGPGPVWVERHGSLTPTSVTVDESMLRVIIERIVSPLGLRIDRTQPVADARLPDGSRVNIAVPPLALDGPYVTIRRFRAEPHALGDFCSNAVRHLLIEAVRSRHSLLISGGTGSGKTSLLNALCAHVAKGERVITIEDAAELRLPGSHTVRLEARPPNAEGVGEIAIRALVRNALRMRPDRIVVGEVRGPEALDMVQAMNTGHDGSMATCHANSPIDALRRVEAMALMSDVDLPATVMREHVAAAIDLVVHVARSIDGHRQVHSVYRCSDGAWLVRAGECVT